MSEEQSVFTCSFCEKRQHETRFMIEGKSAVICGDCVAHCSEIIAHQLRGEVRLIPTPTPDRKEAGE